MANNRTFTTKEFAELVNRDIRTLYAWTREGKLIPSKDFSGRNRYTVEDYKTVTGVEYEEGGGVSYGT